MSIFESYTVKRNCPVQIFRKNMKDLIQTLGVYLTGFTVFFWRY